VTGTVVDGDLFRQLGDRLIEDPDMSCFLDNVDTPQPRDHARGGAGLSYPEPVPEEPTMNGCDQLLAVP
jgi:hypothetical protein